VRMAPVVTLLVPVLVRVRVPVWVDIVVVVVVMMTEYSPSPRRPWARSRVR
jgi:hypothetical protein